jgi:hypothetical protein
MSVTRARSCTSRYGAWFPKKTVLQLLVATKAITAATATILYDIILYLFVRSTL